MLTPQRMVREDLCIGCGACVARTPATGARMQLDARGLLRPAGPPGWGGAAPGFDQLCPFSPGAADEDEIAAELFPLAPCHDAATGRYIAAYVGHAAEGDFRLQGSSGGLVSWVAATLLREGQVDAVVHVQGSDAGDDGRYFRYRVSRSEAELRAGAKSRYHPVELSEVLRVIAEVPGRYALVGIPCFIKAVQLLRRQDAMFRERIVLTLGLFCGHMKSVHFVGSLAWQMDTVPARVRHVEFRRKQPDRPASWYNATLQLDDGQLRDRDWWHLVDGDWGAGFFMDPACNFCDDVMAETADIAFGDAWVEPYASDWRGTNVVVVRSPALAELLTRGIADGRLQLQPVDAGFVAATQAAGLRQRREGLAYRLARRRRERRRLQPRKRVQANAAAADVQRQLIYRLRAAITAGSHRMFRLAERLHLPRLYLAWARIALTAYGALAYHRGRWGRLVSWLRLT
ncbi:MAG TPA: Coenzyme F420 hydrogenase/dehydrogenase, beta subunit C-terminal domain [Stenotrophomonas sp.]|nr:Coenzyme F420 hydrogenase/dehydrogenase, beta subunit C-terminal domain [Stenotrophomonas sp.]